MNKQILVVGETIVRTTLLDIIALAGMYLVFSMLYTWLYYRGMLLVQQPIFLLGVPTVLLVLMRTMFFYLWERKKHLLRGYWRWKLYWWPTLSFLLLGGVFYYFLSSSMGNLSLSQLSFLYDSLTTGLFIILFIQLVGQVTLTIFFLPENHP